MGGFARQAVAAVLTAALGAGASAATTTATARADSFGLFCPGGGGTISLGPYAGCTHSIAHFLTQISGYHSSGATVNHCVTSKGNPGGTGGNITPAVCGYGSAPYGYVHTAYFGVGRWSYAKLKNNEGVTHYDFYGNFNFVGS